MIVHGGEPPFIETPEPKFGGVVNKLNEMTYKLQDCTYSFNENSKVRLLEFSQNLAQFIIDVVTPIDNHLALRGAVHGETKSTIGLSKKDNYRTATLAEQTNLTPVLAYVTPQGVKAALDKNIATYNPSLYQSNDNLQLSSFYYPNEFPVVPPTAVQPVRYFLNNARHTTLINGDRVLVSPRSDPGTYQRQDLFISNPVAIKRRTQLSEIQNLVSGYLGSNWNASAAETTGGRVALFKPLADKQIYDMRSNLNMSGTNKNYLLFNGYGTSLYKGLATAVAVAGNVVTIQHKFFKVDLFDTDPVLVDLVASNYQATFIQLGKTTSGPANGSHSYNISDFLTLSPGQTAVYDGSGAGVTTGMAWAAQDFELYLMINIPIKVNGVSMIISLVESITPGKLSAGSSAQFRQMGTLTKDVIGPDLVPVEPAKWVKLSDLTDFNNVVEFPGVVLPNGEVVKSSATKYAVRVKRLESGRQNIIDWMVNARPKVDVKSVRTEMYTPSRYTPFGPLPERIIPVTQANGVTTYLTYGLDEISGNYMWRELIWSTNPRVVINGGNGKSSFGMPDFSNRLPNLSNVPKALSVMTGVQNGGVVVSAFCFTTQNEFTGYQSFSYANKTVSLGAQIQLHPSSINSLKSAAAAVMTRAGTLNPGIVNASRKTNIQVMDRHDGRLFVMISDGVSYAEGTTLAHTVEDGKVRLTIPASGFGLVPLTAGGFSSVGNNRESLSGDNPRQPYSDILIAAEIPARNWDIVFPRAFGEVYGDISFNIDLPQSAVPTIRPKYVNQGRLYKGEQQFDLVNELLPPVLVPFYGVVQYLPTNNNFNSLMVRPTLGDGVDPYDVNEAGWVRIPAGARVIIRGRAYILDKEYPVKVNPAGVTYCYLVRIGDTLSAIGSSTMRETSNGEVLFGVSTNGVLSINNSYLVIDNHVITSVRRGGAIPVFTDDGDRGVNTFFTVRDLIN